MGSWELQRWVIYDHDIDTICLGWWGAKTSDTQHSESWVIEERKGTRWWRRGKRRYGCRERFIDSSHTSCQVLGLGMQSMTSLLCGGAELLSNLTASAPPLLWFCLGWIKKAQMEHRTWRWAGSPKMSWRRPSACGRLVRSILVEAEHRPIHPANKAYPGQCYDCVKREEPLFLTQTLSLWNPFALSCHAAVLANKLEPEQETQATGHGGGTTALSLRVCERKWKGNLRIRAQYPEVLIECILLGYEVKTEKMMRNKLYMTRAVQKKGVSTLNDVSYSGSHSRCAKLLSNPEEMQVLVSHLAILTKCDKYLYSVDS